MKTNLDFEQETTKKILSKYNFKFFLQLNIEREGYSQTAIGEIYNGYNTARTLIRAKSKKNKKQFGYYAEGQVRKMFIGGFLPSMFELDESTQHVFYDFPSIGENWAYFSYWQEYHKRKLTWVKVWDIIVKTGTLLAFLLSISKASELIAQYLHKK